MHHHTGIQHHTQDYVFSSHLAAVFQVSHRYWNSAASCSAAVVSVELCFSLVLTACRPGSFRQRLLGPLLLSLFVGRQMWVDTWHLQMKQQRLDTYYFQSEAYATCVQSSCHHEWNGFLLGRTRCFCDCSAVCSSLCCWSPDGSTSTPDSTSTGASPLVHNRDDTCEYIDHYGTVVRSVYVVVSMRPSLGLWGEANLSAVPHDEMHPSSNTFNLLQCPRWIYMELIVNSVEDSIFFVVAMLSSNKGSPLEK